MIRHSRPAPTTSGILNFPVLVRSNCSQRDLIPLREGERRAIAIAGPELQLSPTTIHCTPRLAPSETPLPSCVAVALTTDRSGGLNAPDSNT